MANTYKNIVVTPNIGSAIDDPKIVFSGANTSTNTDITLRVYPTSNGTLSFEGSAGQLFSVTNQLTGTLFSVNDISGIPSIEVLDTGLIRLAQYSGNVGIGTASASYKLDVNGTARISGNLVFSNTTSNGITFADGTRQTSAFVGVSIDQFARDTANLSIGVDATQNTRLNAVETINTNQNTSITIIQGVDTTQNTQIGGIQGVDLAQNTSITTLNSQVAIIQGVDVTQNTRLNSIETINTNQNTTITAVNQFTQSAYDKANTASTNQIDQYARDTANSAATVNTNQNTFISIIQGVDTTQNTRLNSIETVDVNQNTAIAIIQGVDLTQNTSIANKLSLTGALNQTVSGNVTIGQDLIISGNLILTGNINTQNVQQLAVSDPLILLGIGNYVSDTKDIGFASHYNDGVNAHAGFIRDSSTKEFYVFQGYTAEVGTSNNVDINNASFVRANLNAGIFKGNLIATTAVVNGIDVRSVQDTQNTRLNSIETINTDQNTAISIIQGVDATQNIRLNAVETINTNQNTTISIIQGVDVTQNTQIGGIQGVDLAQNTSITTLNSQVAIIQGVDLGQNTTITAVNQFAQAAYNQANTASTAGIDTYARNTANLAIGIDATQNTQIAGLQGVDLATNSAISIIQGVDLTQNTNITAVNNYAASAYGTANGANGLAAGAFNLANTHTSQIAIIQGVDLGQNTTITAVNQFAASAYNTANGANGLASGAYNQANVTIGVDATQNTQIGGIQGVDLAQNSAISIIQGVDLGQNTTITAVNQFAQAAYNKANTGTSITSGFLPNAIIFANTTGYLSNTNTLLFTASNNTVATSNVYVSNRVGFANSNNISVVYQAYNANTNSLDTIFG